MCFLDEGSGGARDPVLAWLLALDVAVLGLVVAVNCSLAAAMLRRRRALFSACPASRFVLSMCLADLSVAGTSCYHRSFTYLCPVRRALSRNRAACVARFALMVLSFLASSHSLMLLALDRYCAVVHALRYRQIVSQWRSCLIVAVAWLLAAAIAAALFAWNHWSPQHPCEEQFVMPQWYIGVVVGISHGLVFGTVAATHVKIHRLASRQHHRRLQQLQQEPQQQQPQRQLLSASGRVLLLLTSCYVACWTPFLLVLAVRQFLHSYDQPLERLFHATFSFATLNYVFNSFIFSWKNRAVRAAVLELFACSRRLQGFSEPCATPVTVI